MNRTGVRVAKKRISRFKMTLNYWQLLFFSLFFLLLSNDILIRHQVVKRYERVFCFQIAILNKKSG
ncbi:MAG: hypothetical protein ACJAYJ_003045 [Saprospiraceae bacterium]|jgi:hypothetical protein